MSNTNLNPKLRLITNEGAQPMVFFVFNKFWLSADQLKILVESEPNTVCNFGTTRDEIEKKKFVAHDGKNVVFIVDDVTQGSVPFSTIAFLATLTERDAKATTTEDQTAVLAALKKVQQ